MKWPSSRSVAFIWLLAALSLIGWLITAEDTEIKIFALAFAAAITLTCGIYAIHRLIDRRIDELGRL